MKCYFLLFLFGILTGCTTPQGTEKEPQRYAEQYRPQYHFSPDHNWTNDPNGMVYYDGEYHLFYQFNPYGNQWGHMSWGHAVTKDLLHWEHLPVAISEYTDRATGDSTMIFSGSAVVDTNNTSGFFSNQPGGIVAIYTSHLHRGGQQLAQHQSIAYSGDKGRTFTTFDKNPVLDIKKKDFRDPKVFWYEPEKKWIMAAVIPDKFMAHFYESKDLKDWKFLSEFGPLGDTAKIWECPDLIQVPMIDDRSSRRWVLLISNSHPQGPTYVGMQYFTGQFDGKTFTPDNPKQYPLYLDYGKDFYAAVTFNNIPQEDGRTILIGWANNWAYGNVIPTFPWKSAMTLPREVYLTSTVNGLRMIQRPVREIESLRDQEIDDFSNNMERAIEIAYELTPARGGIAGLKILKGDSTETRIGYDATTGEVFFDRTNSGNVDFHPTFSSIERALVRLVNGKVKLQIYIDHSVVEVYVNGGEQVITNQVFPGKGNAGIETYFEGDQPLISYKAWTLKSIWR